METPITNQPLESEKTDNFKELITITGKYWGCAFKLFGDISKFGVQKAGKYINDKIEPASNGQISQETKQKWQTVKSGASIVLQTSIQAYNSFVHPVLVKPVLDKGTNGLTNLKQKMQTSQNGRYAIEIVQTSKNAFGQAFQGLVSGSKQVGSELTKQTIDVVQKKYGEDYVKTFILNQKAGQLQQRQIQNLNPSGDTLEYPNLSESKLKQI